MKAVSKQNSKHYSGLWWLCQGGLLVGLCGFMSFVVLSGCAVSSEPLQATTSTGSRFNRGEARAKKKVVHRLCARCGEDATGTDAVKPSGKSDSKDGLRVEPVNFIR